MNAEEVSEIVKYELEKAEDFNNSHGISKDNLKNFLIKPTSIQCDPDDEKSPERQMWAVLSLSSKLGEDKAVIFDPKENLWGVAEKIKAANKWVLVIAGESIAEALEGM